MARSRGFQQMTHSAPFLTLIGSRAAFSRRLADVLENFLRRSFLLVGQPRGKTESAHYNTRVPGQILIG